MAATVEFSELIGQYVDDVFSPFPSSPEQVAVFSPGASSPFDDGEHEVEYFNSAFELKSHTIHAMKPQQFSAAPLPLPQLLNEPITAQSLKRKAIQTTDAIDSVPELPRKKQALIEQDTQFPFPLWPSNDPQQLVCPPFPSQTQQQQQQLSIKASNQIQLQQLQQLHLKKIQQQQQQPTIAVHPSSITPSRIKSTTPNLKLLFSLFDVLENDNGADTISQPETTSQYVSRSPSPVFSRSSSPSSSSSNSPSPSPYHEEQSQNIIYINSHLPQQQQQQSHSYEQHDYSSPVSSPAHCVPEFEPTSASTTLSVAPNMFFSVTSPTTPTFAMPMTMFSTQQQQQHNNPIAAGQY